MTAGHTPDAGGTFATAVSIGDTQAYGYAVTIGPSASCEQDVVAQLVDLRREAATTRHATGGLPPTTISS